MKQYTVINNKTGKQYNYSLLAWNIAWALAFIAGTLLGIFLF
jgi:hypothetical protein